MRYWNYLRGPTSKIGEMPKFEPCDPWSLERPLSKQTATVG